MIKSYSVTLTCVVLLASCALPARVPTDGFVPCKINRSLLECVTVPLASPEEDRIAKEFRSPASDKAKIYIIRRYNIEPRNRSEIFINGKYAAAMAPQTYIEITVNPGEHTIKARTTDEADLRLNVMPGQIYYVKYTLTLWLYKATGDLRVVSEKYGQSLVRESKKAVSRVD